MRRWTAFISSSSARAHLSVPALALLSLAAWGCDEHVTPTSAAASAVSIHVRFDARVAGAVEQITGVSLHVTGPGIEEPVVIDLGVPDSLGRLATSEARIPAGPDRIFRAYAYTRHVLTHYSADTVDVTSSGLQLRLDLRKFPGSEPYTGTTREFVLRMDDSTVFAEDADTTWIPAGGKRFLSVELTARSAIGGLGVVAGDPVPDIPISWGVAASDLVQVSSWLCVTDSTGQCSIRVFVSPDAPAGSHHPVFASAGGVADRVVIVIE